MPQSSKTSPNAQKTSLATSTRSAVSVHARVRPLRKTDFEALADFRATLRRFLHFSEASARDCGITPQQHQVLLAIKGRPKRDWATVSEIAEALQLSHHAAVGLVDRCARGGWARREENPEDRRRVRVVLTSQGEEVLEELSQKNRRELQKLRAALNVLLLED